MLKKLPLLTILTTFATFSFTHFAHAVCPVCTIAVGVGVGLTRKYGIDDTLSGLWVGGLLVSVSMWTINWLKAKKISFPARNLIVPLVYYAITLIPLYQKNIISQKIFGDHNQTLWGIDKLMLGVAIGSITFLIGALGYESLKAANGGKAHFPYQKIVMPIAPLIILSIIFYFITRG